MGTTIGLRLGVEKIWLSIWKIMVISYIFDNLLVGCLFNDKLGSKYYIIVGWPYCSFNYNLSQGE